MLPSTGPLHFFFGVVIGCECGIQTSCHTEMIQVLKTKGYSFNFI